MKKATAPWLWPRISARTTLGLFSISFAIGIVQGAAVHAAMTSQGTKLPAHVPFIWHITGAVAAWLAFPLVQTAVVNTRGLHVGWRRLILFHLGGYLSFTAVHVAAMLGLRWGIFHLAGLGTPAHTLTYQILWEAQGDVVVYAGLAVLWILLLAREERREAIVHAAELEAQLVSARLQALAGQLDPHFLFNALNTISAVMYEDLDRTEHLLDSLGQLLRTTLAPGAATWTIADEQAHARRYVELIEARFGDRLSVSWDIAPTLEGVHIARFALQSLIENSVKHNRERSQPLVVRVAGTNDGARACLVVEDNGYGFQALSNLDTTHGLGRLQETLRLLHGESASLELSSASMGGARVVLRFPHGGEC